MMLLPGLAASLSGSGVAFGRRVLLVAKRLRVSIRDREGLFVCCVWESEVLIGA